MASTGCAWTRWPPCSIATTAGPKGEWIPNRYGGRENLEAIAFLRDVNQIIGEQAPGTVTMAEESTAFPGVTKPPWAHGLGFNYKWNMGWMHDTLGYFARDPIHAPVPPRPASASS